MTSPQFASTDPATGKIVWQGTAASGPECAEAVRKSRSAFATWSATPLEERIAIARKFAAIAGEQREELASLISRETGKILWETLGEVGAMIGKVEISVAAQAERAGERSNDMPFGQAVLRHRPHGVMAVLGPYNFPAHLPNGHIVPALLAGNTVVFKPSELTPAVAEAMAGLWAQAGLPDDVLQIVQGGRDTGAALLEQDIDGLLFTGSAAAGAHFRRAFADRPNVILALELGGNNPLIAWDGDPVAAASIIVQSAFISSGQRCTCARRLIVPEGPVGDAIVDATAVLTNRLTVGTWDDKAEPFMGPVISDHAAGLAERGVAELVSSGAREIVPFERNGPSRAFVTPAILDVTGMDLPDAELFAPILKVIRVGTFEKAIEEANNTAFGLSAGLISENAELWRTFSTFARAGIVNWNRPTTGAASNMPFGGLGESGNHRPSAYYAADYCAFPMASFEAPQVSDQSGAIKGLKEA